MSSNWKVLALAGFVASCSNSSGSSGTVDLGPPVGPLPQGLSTAGGWGTVPLYGAGTYSTTIPSDGDAVDIYYPTSAGSFPVVVLLQGANVDKAQYSTYAGNVARFGFVVFVPNQVVGDAGTTLYATEGEIPADLAFAASEGARPGSPLNGIVDATRLGLLGHSYGSVVALYAVAGKCSIPFCTAGAYTRPSALRAAALWGAELELAGILLPIDTSFAPVAFLEGTLDGLAPPNESLATYGELAAPKAYITFSGVNHYGITDVNEPAGAQADPHAQTTDQQTSITNASLFAGLFLRAHVSDDAAAGAILAQIGSSYPGVVAQVASK